MIEARRESTARSPVHHGLPGHDRAVLATVRAVGDPGAAAGGRGQCRAGCGPPSGCVPTRRPGEIDVMEAWGTPADHPRTGPATYAWNVHEDTTVHRARAAGASRLGHHRRTGPRWPTDFHVFAVDWSPSASSSQPRRQDAPVRSPWTRRPWLAESLRGHREHAPQPPGRQPRSGDGSTPIGPSLTRLPAALVVDYVRVYRMPNESIRSNRQKSADRHGFRTLDRIRAISRDRRHNDPARTLLHG